MFKYRLSVGCEITRLVASGTSFLRVQRSGLAIPLANWQVSICQSENSNENCPQGIQNGINAAMGAYRKRRSPGPATQCRDWGRYMGSRVPRRHLLVARTSQA